jgi:hypothetical protein
MARVDVKEIGIQLKDMENSSKSVTCSIFCLEINRLSGRMDHRSLTVVVGGRGPAKRLLELLRRELSRVWTVAMGVKEDHISDSFKREESSALGDKGSGMQWEDEDF